MKDEMREIFKEKIKFQSATGIDKVRPEKFEKKLQKEIDSIVSSYQSSTYKFKPYKELLILKGRDKPPRLVSIPTVKDKLILSWLNKKLITGLEWKHVEVYQIVKKIKEYIEQGVRVYMKLDLKGFYDNIEHSQLLKLLGSKGIDNLDISLVKSAIQNETVALNRKRTGQLNIKGVPQGIPISNVLANIFVSRIDSLFDENADVFLIRYVDDILLLSNSNDHLNSAYNRLQSVLKKLDLPFNDEKKDDGNIAKGFDFLGYHFIHKNRLKLSVRNASFKNLFFSLLHQIGKFKHEVKNGKNWKERCLWDLNLKITGGLIDKNRYGWLFFFSQMDEDNIQLYQLDQFIKKMLRERNIPTDGVKSYVRAHKEIRNNLKNSKYIPNFDNYTIEQKKSFLEEIVGLDEKELDEFTDTQIEYHFKKFLFKTIRTLEKDILSTS